MRVPTVLAALAALSGIATAAALPKVGGGPDTLEKQEVLERARAQCNALPGGRREVCLRTIADPKHSLVLVWSDSDLAKRDDAALATSATPDSETTWQEAGFWQNVGLGPRDVGVGDEVAHVGDGQALIFKKLVDVSPDGKPYVCIHAHGGAQTDLDCEHEKSQHDRRDVEVTALDSGAIDLAIPIPAIPPPSPLVWTPALQPTPTTLRTVTTHSPSKTGLGPITIDDTISLATTTYPVHRTLQTATLANGTEVRIEQTESQAHDVHVEETEREKDAPEQDRVVVHVKVFVEHVKEAAEKVAKVVKKRFWDEWPGSLGKRGDQGIRGHDRLAVEDFMDEPEKERIDVVEAEVDDMMKREDQGARPSRSEIAQEPEQEGTELYRTAFWGKADGLMKRGSGPKPKISWPNLKAWWPFKHNKRPRPDDSPPSDTDGEGDDY